MILTALAEELKRDAKGEFKKRDFGAGLIIMRPPSDCAIP
jgi:hypothetical protein